MWHSVARTIVGIIAIPFSLRGRLDRVEGGLRVIVSQSSQHLALLGTLIRILHRRQALDDQEFQEVLQAYAELSRGPIEALISSEIGRGNPLTREEAQRLEGLWNKARHGEWFSPQEVDEYNRLARKIEHEKPNDPGVWPLLALGAFLLGLFPGGRKDGAEKG